MTHPEPVAEQTLTGYLLGQYRQHKEATMAQMPESIAGDAARALGFVERHLPHRAHPQPSFSPNTQPSTASKESTMSAEFAEIGHFLTVADKDTVHAINVILAHPEGLAVVGTLATAAGLPLPAGGLTALLTGAELVGSLFQQPPAPAPQQQPEPAQQGNGTGSQPMAPRVI